MGLTRDEAERCGIGALHPGGEGVAKPRRGKYRNVRTAYAGVNYASKSEAARAAKLDDLKAAGLVLWWIGQPKFRLGVPENVYVPDFLVVSVTGEVRAEDVKGVETAKFSRDRKLWRAYGPIDLWVIRGGGVEVIRPENGQK